MEIMCKMKTVTENHTKEKGEGKRIMLLQYLTLLETEHGREYFTNLYKKHKDEVYHKAYMILHNAEDAENIVQETFLSLLRNADKMLDSEPCRVWFYMDTVVKNKSYNLLKQREMQKNA